MTILTSLLGTKMLGFLALLWQEATPAPTPAADNTFTITEMIKNMGAVAIVVVIILLIMSVYSIAIMVERYLTYSAAKKQSREFAPRVAQALKNNRIEEAINISDKHRKSHLAMVVNSGLQEFRAHEQSTELSGDEIEASKRALQRAIAIKTAEFRRGLSGLFRVQFPVIGYVPGEGLVELLLQIGHILLFRRDPVLHALFLDDRRRFHRLDLAAAIAFDHPLDRVAEEQERERM